MNWTAALLCRSELLGFCRR
ncbi:MprA protease, GlyGly-CTERM protein-sorting domain-containing form [Paenibacillus phytohabitans]